jgi:hypothetical protein
MEELAAIFEAIIVSLCHRCSPQVRPPVLSFRRMAADGILTSSQRHTGFKPDTESLACHLLVVFLIKKRQRDARLFPLSLLLSFKGENQNITVEERAGKGSDCLSTSAAMDRRSAWLKAEGSEAQPHSLEPTAIHSVCSSTFADVARNSGSVSR